MIWLLLAVLGAAALVGFIVHALYSWIGKLPEDY